MCQYCENRSDNDFVILNDTVEYSDIEMALNRQGMLRVRYFEQGEYDLFYSQDIINVKFCPMCGRKLST